MALLTAKKMVAMTLNLDERMHAELQRQILVNGSCLIRIDGEGKFEIVPVLLTQPHKIILESGKEPISGKAS